MDRSAVLQSPAYAALTPSGKRCLHLIEDEVERCGGVAAIPRPVFMARRISKKSVSFGIKQCEHLGFISNTVGVGARHANVFRWSMTGARSMPPKLRGWWSWRICRSRSAWQRRGR